MSAVAKICGVNSVPAVEAAARADFVGFNFFPRSPRYVKPELARFLADRLPRRVRRVALIVDLDDTAIDAILSGFRPDILQLHGAETPARVAEIRRRTGLPIMKVIGVSDGADLDAATAYLDVADRLMFDAKPPKRVGALPGGNAVSFDWTLLAGRNWKLPWMLAGGLTAANVAAAITTAGAPAVDVSSGVEDRPGHKSPRLIRRFLAAVRAV
ncbi:MAG: phosphoribosylanthranilate isomerase [Alphaproteobacteria bacterium]|nr:phosphoribosylanthranilate isomerase [Alphaproteobacteria bacterium]